jgi:hypothetical protein
MEFHGVLYKPKSEIRNPKSETNLKLEIQNSNPSLLFGHSDFEFVSDFNFRISDLRGGLPLIPKVLFFLGFAE